MNPQAVNFNDFIIRPPRLDEIPAIVALLNADSKNNLRLRLNMSNHEKVSTQHSGKKGENDSNSDLHLVD